MEPKGVYKAIAAVQADLSKEGISKNRDNKMQGYKFRGIDDVYNALAPILATHGLCILPRMIDRSVTERETKNGGALFYVVVTAEFDLVFAGDGSQHTIRTYGEAMDSGDKATNKAMSAAYKYAAMQAFAIPTEGDNDADATTHEVAAQGKPATVTPLKPVAKLSAQADGAPVTVSGQVVKVEEKQGPKATYYVVTLDTCREWIKAFGKSAKAAAALQVGEQVTIDGKWNEYQGRFSINADVISHDREIAMRDSVVNSDDIPF